MNVKSLCVVGAAMGCMGVANAQMQSEAANGVAGNPYVAPAGSAIYSNPYDGTSTFGNAAQIFEPTFSGYNIWLGDDFTADAAYDQIEISVVGFCGNGCVDPFNVTNFFGMIWDGLPNDPNSNVVAESVDWNFNGIDTWTAEFGDDCIPAGDFHFGIAAENSFTTNGQTYFFQQNTQNPNNGWQWNPNGAFGFPNNLLLPITQQDGISPASPNAVITGTEIAECEDGGGKCFADCNGDGNLSILDFVCYQGAFQAGGDDADCNGDGQLSILDFVCFQGEFQAGCP